MERTTRTTKRRRGSSSSELWRRRPVRGTCGPRAAPGQGRTPTSSRGSSSSGRRRPRVRPALARRRLPALARHGNKNHGASRRRWALAPAQAARPVGPAATGRSAHAKSRATPERAQCPRPPPEARVSGAPRARAALRHRRKPSRSPTRGSVGSSRGAREDTPMNAARRRLRRQAPCMLQGHHQRQRTSLPPSPPPPSSRRHR